MIFIDQDGNEVDLDITGVEDFNKMKEQVAKLPDLEAKLAMYDGKEMSIKRLKDLSEEEKAKLTAAQLQERAEKEKMQEELGRVKDTMKNGWVKNKIKELGVEDEDTKKKIMKMAGAIADDVELGTNSETEEGIYKKIELAYNAAGLNSKPTGPVSHIDPIFASNAGATTGFVPQRKDGWEESDEFKALSNKLLNK